MNRLFWLRVLSGHTLRLLLLMSVLLPSAAFALESQDSSRMARFEQQFFARAYPQETVEQRLNRLEDVVYGKNQAGSVNIRLSRLLQALEKQYAPVKLPPVKRAVPVPADSTDFYPTVTAIERAVFKQAFIRQPITERLSRLEMQTFHITYPKNSHSDRVDRLVDYYPNEVRMARIAQIARERQDVIKPQEEAKAISPVVEKLPPLPTDSRTIAQVPKSERRRVFFARKTDTSIISAAKSSKNDQIQFGMGVSQGQSTQYSQEMMQMLPPQVRAQMSGQRSPAPQVRQRSQQRIPTTPAVPLQPTEPTAPTTTTSTPSTPGFLGVPLQ